MFRQMLGLLITPAIVSIIADISVAQDTVETEKLLGVELRLDLNGRDLYLNSYCAAQKVCVVLFDNIQISFILNDNRYKFIFYDTNGSDSLHSVTGSSEFSLFSNEEEIFALLFGGSPLNSARVGSFRARRLVEP